MQTMDSLTDAPAGARCSPAAARNTGPILAVLKTHLPGRGRVLEVASGTGQHAAAFSAAFPGLEWTPSDPAEDSRASIDAWGADASLPNLTPALALDVLDPDQWPEGPFQALVCINMIHISPWPATDALMGLAQRALATGGLLVLYGPFREADAPLAPSNAAFDDSLKSRDPDWGLRDRDAVVAAAKAHGLALTRRVEMPANNIMLLFRRT
ncbi:MAG TPA: DUF938 domain-containing protein [Brevundimonas sp.]|nr:DUF938 domain-containing protein [Brevundimonas sp.]